MKNNIDFKSPNVIEFLENASLEELDQLNFGVVKVDNEGNVQIYNKYESEMAALDKEEVIGKNFFHQVAPCTNNFMVAEKYTNAKEEVDELLDYIFTYKIEPTPVELRMLISPGRSSQYLLVRQKDK